MIYNKIVQQMAKILIRAISIINGLKDFDQSQTYEKCTKNFYQNFNHHGHNIYFNLILLKIANSLWPYCHLMWLCNNLEFISISTSTSRV